MIAAYGKDEPQMDINLFMALFAEAAESAPAQAAKSPQQVMFSFAMLLGMGLIIVWMLFILPRRGMEKRANQQKKLLFVYLKR